MLVKKNNFYLDRVENPDIRFNDKLLIGVTIDNEDIIISATWYTSTSIDGRSHTFGYLLTTFYNNNLDITVRGNMVESEKIDTVIIEYTKTTN